MKLFSNLRINPWREIAIFMMLIMEVCWVTPWFRSMTPQTYAVNETWVFTILLLMVLFSHALVRIMEALHLKKSIRQGLMAFFIIVGSYIGIKTLLYPHQAMSLTQLLTQPLRSFADLKSLIPVEFIVIIAVLISFWRGLSIAQQHIGPSAVMEHFWIGIVMYLAFIFFNTMVTGETPGNFFFLFLFASLVAMCSARLTVVGMLRGGRENKFNRYWFIGIILIASFTVGIAALLGGQVGDKFGWIGGLLFAAFGSILIIIWLIFNPVITLLINFLSKIFQSKSLEALSNDLDNLNQLFQGLSQRILDLVGMSGVGDFITRVGPTLKQILFITIIALLILGVIAWMAIRLWRDRQRRRLENDQASNLKANNIAQLLLNMLKQGWNGAISALGGLTDFNRRQKLKAAARIRQIYADLMELCENLEHPRADAETPLEFMPKLNLIFPELLSEISTITEAYNRVRYGLLPETRQEVLDVESAWSRIDQAGRTMMADVKHAKKK
jgi:ABC-type multidrug transport system fused ATPase/permease subunit